MIRYTLPTLNTEPIRTILDQMAATMERVSAHVMREQAKTLNTRSIISKGLFNTILNTEETDR